MDKLVERLEEMDREATKGPWAFWEEQRNMEHGLVRNLRLAVGGGSRTVYWTTANNDEMAASDIANARMLVALRNALPALVEYVKASDDLAAEYAHYLNERDGVQRELDPYDTAHATLLAALGGTR